MPVVVLTVVSPILGNIFAGIMYRWMPLVFSFSMYLMMDYNQELYYKVLKAIRCLWLQYIFCCCCGFMVNEQLYQIEMNDIEGNLDEERREKSVDTKTVNQTVCTKSNEVSVETP